MEAAKNAKSPNRQLFGWISEGEWVYVVVFDLRPTRHLSSPRRSGSGWVVDTARLFRRCENPDRSGIIRRYACRSRSVLHPTREMAIDVSGSLAKAAASPHRRRISRPIIPLASGFPAC